MRYTYNDISNNNSLEYLLLTSVFKNDGINPHWHYKNYIELNFLKMKRLVLILHFKILVNVESKTKSISSKFYFCQKSREKFQLFDYTLKTHLSCFQNRSTHDGCTVDGNKRVFICSRHREPTAWELRWTFPLCFQVSEIICFELKINFLVLKTIPCLKLFFLYPTYPCPFFLSNSFIIFKFFFPCLFKGRLSYPHPGTDNLLMLNGKFYQSFYVSIWFIQMKMI